MILVDATAWIEYLRATGSNVDVALREHLDADAPADYEPAADLYRRCHETGNRVRRLPECVFHRHAKWCSSPARR